MILPELTKRLLSRWPDVFPGQTRPKDLFYLGIPGSVEGGTTTFLGFPVGSEKPVCAVKVHRSTREESRAAHEHEVLTRIAQSSIKMPPRVPRALLCEKISGHWVLVQSILEGAPMVAKLNSDGSPDLDAAQENMSLTAQWLLDLHKELPSSTGEAGLVDEAEKSIARFKELFPLDADENLFLEGLRASLGDLAKSAHPLQHGDFCRQNILVAGEGSKTLNVIDWTDSRLRGFPLHDYYFFLTTYCLQVRREAGIQGFIRTFEDSFLKNTDYNNVIRQNVAHYCRELGFNRTQMRHLFGLFLVQQAVFEYGKLERFSTEGGMPRFTLFLAAESGLNLDEAKRQQLWIYFFRALIKKLDQFNL